MISKNHLTFPFYIPRICGLLSNWPTYLVNYSLRRKIPAEYKMRNGLRLIDGTGTLAGTIAVVFIRREYGQLEQFRTIVDIGANMGSFAIFAAKSCPGARIYCYEPELRNFGNLKENIEINSFEGRVSAFQCAVASTSGQRDLGVDESPLNSFHSTKAKGKCQLVNCTTVNEILTTHGLQTVDLLKVNCEGAEYEIIESCSAADFKRIANIRLEYHNLDDAKRNGRSISRFLENKGYEIQRFTRYIEKSGLFKESGFIWATRAK